MSLGANYFDRSMIELMNSHIRQVAKKNDLYLVDMNVYFQKKEKKGFTIDGVHLTASSYKYFNKQMASALPKNCIN